MMPTFCNNGSVAMVDVDAVTNKQSEIGSQCVFLFYKLITMMDDEHNEIHASRDEICVIADVSKRLLTKSLKNLKNANMIRFTIDGIAINPEYASRGSVDDVSKRVDEWSKMTNATKTLWEFQE